MDHDQILVAVTRLEAVAERFESTAQKVDDHAARIASLEGSRRSTRTVGKWVAGIVGPIIVGLALAFLVSKGVGR